MVSCFLFFFLQISSAESLGSASFSSNKVNLAEAVKNPKNYENMKMIIEGKVTYICKRAGCCAHLVKDNRTLRIESNKKSFIFPKKLMSKNLWAEGTLAYEKDATDTSSTLYFIADGIKF